MNGEGNPIVNDGGGDQSLNGDFQQLLNSVQNTGEAPELELPDTIGELPLENFNKAIHEATGGQLQDYKSLNEVVGLKAKYQELQEKLGRLEVERQEYSGGPKYGNELSAKIDDLVKHGATNEQIAEFVRLQSMDLGAMNDLDKVKLHYQNEYKGASEEAILELIAEELGVDDLSELEGRASAKLMKMAKQANAFLEEQKVTISEPEHIKQQKQLQQQMQQQFGNWQRLLNTTYSGREKHDFTLDLGDDQTYASSFPIPEEFRTHLANEVAKYAVQNNIPVTTEGYAALQDVAERMLFFKYGKEMMAATIRDVMGRTKEEVLRSNHNVETIGRGSGGNSNRTKKEPTGKSKLKRLY